MCAVRPGTDSESGSKFHCKIVFSEKGNCKPGSLAMHITQGILKFQRGRGILMIEVAQV